MGVRFRLIGLHCAAATRRVGSGSALDDWRFVVLEATVLAPTTTSEGLEGPPHSTRIDLLRDEEGDNAPDLDTAGGGAFAVRQNAPKAAHGHGVNINSSK